MLNLLYGLKVFDIVFVLTRGGPGRATDTVYTAIFDDFSKGRYGHRHGAVDAALPGDDRAQLRDDPRCMRREEDALTCASPPTVRGTFNHLIGELASGCIVFAPIYLVFVNALKTRVGGELDGRGPAGDARSGRTSRPSSRRASSFGAFVNSVLYSIGATAICVTLSALAAYVLARHRSRRHRIIYLLLIMGIAMPTNFVTLMQVMQWTQPDQHAARHHPALRRDADPVQCLPHLRLHRDDAA